MKKTINQEVMQEIKERIDSLDSYVAIYTKQNNLDMLKDTVHKLAMMRHLFELCQSFESCKNPL